MFRFQGPNCDETVEKHVVDLVILMKITVNLDLMCDLIFLKVSL